MKILTVDDQELVLLSLEKCLTDLGYEVITSSTIEDAIKMYDLTLPDLVIVDINMPLNANCSLEDNHKFSNNFSGLDIIHHIKVIKQQNIPVMILSGNIEEQIIKKGFELGAVDYLKKPISLGEIGARVKKVLGFDSICELENRNAYIQNSVVGVVISCCNDEKNLLIETYENFIKYNLGYHFCFVCDESKDATLQALSNLRKGNESRISIYNCEATAGKAEAVRLGMLHLAKEQQFDYLGFLDIDLTINLEDIKTLVAAIKNSNYKIVTGSRIRQVEAKIKKLNTDKNDNQCGVKIMTKEIIEKTFQKKFLAKSFLNVEIFIRMKKEYGMEKTKMYILEKPLYR